MLATEDGSMTPSGIREGPSRRPECPSGIPSNVTATRFAFMPRTSGEPVSRPDCGASPPASSSNASGTGRSHEKAAIGNARTPDCSLETTSSARCTRREPATSTESLTNNVSCTPPARAAAGIHKATRTTVRNRRNGPRDEELLLFVTANVSVPGRSYTLGNNPNSPSAVVAMI